MPDLAALDLEAHNPGPLDGDNEVDLVVLQAVGDPLASDDEVGGFKLVGKGLPDLALGAVGQARRVGASNRQGAVASVP